MGLEQLYGRGAAHLGGDNAGEVILDGDAVDGMQFAFDNAQYERTLEGLCLLLLPVKLLADGDAMQTEGGGCIAGDELNAVVGGAVDHNGLVGEIRGEGALAQ